MLKVAEPIGNITNSLYYQCFCHFSYCGPTLEPQLSQLMVLIILGVTSRNTAKINNLACHVLHTLKNRDTEELL